LNIWNLGLKGALEARSRLGLVGAGPKSFANERLKKERRGGRPKEKRGWRGLVKVEDLGSRLGGRSGRR